MGASAWLKRRRAPVSVGRSSVGSGPAEGRTAADRRHPDAWPHLSRRRQARRRAANFNRLVEEYHRHGDAKRELDSLKKAASHLLLKRPTRSCRSTSWKFGATLPGIGHSSTMSQPTTRRADHAPRARRLVPSGRPVRARSHRLASRRIERVTIDRDMFSASESIAVDPLLVPRMLKS